MTLEFEFTQSPAADDLNVLNQGLTEHSLQHVDQPGFKPVAFFHRDNDLQIVAGIAGYINWNWAYVLSFWVSEDLRGNHVGTQLIRAFEDYAAQQKCTNIHLDTFSFQAPRLYESLGYVLFATLENYPEGHSRYFYRKPLQP